MASVVPYRALKDFLQNYFAGVYPVIDFDEIDPWLEQSEKPFLMLEELIAEEEMIAMGDSSKMCMRENGTIVVHCFAPAPQASNATRELADQVRDSLRGRTVDGVRIADLSAPDPGELMNSGLWGVAAFIVGYQWDSMHDKPKVQ